MCEPKEVDALAKLIPDTHRALSPNRYPQPRNRRRRASDVD